MEVTAELKLVELKVVATKEEAKAVSEQIDELCACNDCDRVSENHYDETIEEECSDCKYNNLSKIATALRNSALDAQNRDDT